MGQRMEEEGLMLSGNWNRLPRTGSPQPLRELRVFPSCLANTGNVLTLSAKKYTSEATMEIVTTISARLGKYVPRPGTSIASQVTFKRLNTTPKATSKAASSRAAELRRIFRLESITAGTSTPRIISSRKRLPLLLVATPARFPRAARSRIRKPR
ncbi:MAG: hypothetical protein ACYSWU_18725 [Planctomycetota bacterium]